MQILHVVYDDIENPWCGGGGARRVFEMYRRLPSEHTAVVLTGNFPNAGVRDGTNVQYRRCGLAGNYLISRLTFSTHAPKIVQQIPHDILISDFSPFSPVFVHRLTDKPVISIIHHFLGFHTLRKFPLIGIAPYLFEQRHFKHSRYIITVSKQMQDILNSKDPFKHYKCIHNGIDASLLETQPEPGEHFLFLGRIDVYMKGLDILLKAYAQLDSDYKIPLYIAGDGKPKDVRRVWKMIQALGIQSSVHICGRVNDTEKKSLLARAVCVCMPSRFEGWGIVAVEAAAAGKPVIGTRIPGLQEAIIAGETGMLVAPGNVSEFAEAMSQMRQTVQSENQYRTKGKQWASRYNWENLAKMQVDYYQEVINTE